MKNLNRNDVITIIRDVPVKDYPTYNTARLVYINGREKLTARSYTVRDDVYGQRFFTQILLNDTPLVQINAPGCPTCSGLLATGYGLANAHCEELNAVQEKLNEPFVSLDRSIAALTPLLSLMKSGLYMIADAECYPTDGNGRFFWNVPDRFSENPATAEELPLCSNDVCISGHPVFLFPTQDTDCYNEKRVQYYVSLFEKEPDVPRAVVYNFDGFISFVLDGHHKACAAALLKRPLKCIVIIPFSGCSYRQCNFRITAGRISHRKWEKKYCEAAAAYPSVEEYAEFAAAVASCGRPVPDEWIRSCLNHLDEDNQLKMRAILFVMKKENDSRIKKTALSCAGRTKNDILNEEAFGILAGIKNDPEIEQFFVDYLIDHADRHDPVLPIIDLYWR